MTPLVEAKGITKHFRLNAKQVVHAVDGVSLDVYPKEIVGLVGESGSGKSTFGKTLVGLHAKTAGEAFFKGEKLPQKYKPSDFQRYASRMQMIFQDPYSSLNPRMTVGEIIGEGLRLNGKHSSASDSRAGDGLAAKSRARAGSRLSLPARIFRRPTAKSRHCPSPDHAAGICRLR